MGEDWGRPTKPHGNKMSHGVAVAECREQVKIAGRKLPPMKRIGRVWVSPKRDRVVLSWGPKNPLCHARS